MITGTHGDRFPSVEIIDGSGTMYFGAEAFSTANLLQRVLSTLKSMWKHNISIERTMNFLTLKMFVGRNFGYYRYSALQDFWMMLSQ
jgi:hypothetical protein